MPELVKPCAHAKVEKTIRRSLADGKTLEKH